MNNSQTLKLTVHWRCVHCSCTVAVMWRGGNVGVTPSRAECAGVLSVKCHLLCSLTSFAFFLIRQVAVSWLSVAVTHALRETSWGHLGAFRGKEIITVADSSYFVYAHYHRLSFSFHRINLSFSHAILTHLGTAPANVSAYSSGFCEPVTYEVSRISLLLPVIAGWNVCHVIDNIMLGDDGKICWELFSLEWCVRVVRAGNHKPGFICE